MASGARFNVCRYNGSSIVRSKTGHSNVQYASTSRYLGDRAATLKAAGPLRALRFGGGGASDARAGAAGTASWSAAAASATTPVVWATQRQSPSTRHRPASNDPKKAPDRELDVRTPSAWLNPLPMNQGLMEFMTPGHVIECAKRESP